MYSRSLLKLLARCFEKYNLVGYLNALIKLVPWLEISSVLIPFCMSVSFPILPTWWVCCIDVAFFHQLENICKHLMVRVCLGQIWFP